MLNRPYILITNDDGVSAPGIKQLWKAIAAFADVVVVAPSNEQSAVGLSTTIRHPLQIDSITWPGSENASVWSISGTPADCVKFALSVILPRPPQIILSGINRGNNAGRNLLYSGTVAAVIEGIIQNIPGIAFSCADYSNPCYEELEHYIPSFVHYLMEHPLPAGTFLNVNFPKYQAAGIKGIRFAKQGLEYWAENPEERFHPAEGHSYYWLGSKAAEFKEDVDSDVALLKEGYATAVPIHINDLTHYAHFSEHREHFERFVNSKILSSKK